MATLAYLLVLLLAAAKHTDLFVDVKEAPGGNGSSDTPYKLLEDALDHIIQEAGTMSNGDSYAIYLIPGNLPYDLAKTAKFHPKDYIFSQLTKSEIKITIDSWHCSYEDPIPNDCDQTTHPRARISYKHPYGFTVRNEKARITVKNVDFDGSKFFKSDCATESCKHCHSSKALYQDVENTGKYFTGLGEEFADIPTLEAAKFGLEKKCGEQIDQADQANSKPFVDNQDPNKLFKWALFSVEKYSGRLTLTNVKFSDMRMRINAIIALFEGQALLTNVDFDGIEIGSGSLSQRENEAQSNYQYSAMGVIVSTPFNNEINAAKENTAAQTCKQLNSNNAPASPCGSFKWTTGTVRNLNKDVNLYNEATNTSYYGFMTLTFLNTVEITGVNFENNVTPAISSSFSNLLRLEACGTVKLDTMAFTNNIVVSSLIWIATDRKLLAPIDSADTPDYNQVQMTLKALTFQKNWSYQSSIVEIQNEGDGWASIVVDSCKWYNNSQTTPENQALSGNLNIFGTSLVANLKENENPYDGWVNNWTNYYLNGNPDYSVSKVEIVIKDCDFGDYTDKIGNYMKYGLLLVKQPCITITNTHFYYAQAFNRDTIETWSAWKYIADGGLMRPQTYDKQYKGENNGVKCYGQLIIDTAYAFSMSGTNSDPIYVSNNSCNQGYTMSLKNIRKELSMNYINCQDNVVGIATGCIGLAMTTQSAPTLSHLTVSRNKTNLNGSAQAAGLGTMSGNGVEEPKNDSFRLKLSSCEFVDNTADQATAIYFLGAYLSLDQCTFSGNKVKGQNGGVVYFANQVSAATKATTPPGLAITGCTFSSNTDTQSIVADVYATDERQGDVVSTLLIDNCTFEKTSALKTGNLYIKGFQFGALGSPGLITGCTFKDITLKTGEGVIYAAHTKGVLKVYDTTFTNIQSNTLTYIMQVATNTYNSNNGHFILVEKCTISSCKGDIGFIMNDNIQKPLLKFQDVIASENTGVLVYNYFGQFTDDDGTFSSSQNDDDGQYGVIYYGVESGVATFANSKFNGNTSTSEGGVFYITGKGTELTLNTVTANNNTAKKGGVVYAEKKATFDINDSKFNSNTAISGSVIYVVNSSASRGTIADCSMSKNKGNAVVFLLEGSITISDTKITDNTMTNADNNSSGIIGLLSNIESERNTFSRQKCSHGCAFYITEDSELTDTASTIENIQSEGAAGIYLLNSQAMLTGTVLRNLYSAEVGAIYAMSNAQLTMKGVQMSDLSAAKDTQEAAGMLVEENSTIELTACTFTAFNNTAISADRVKSLTLTGTTISNVNAASREGGALYCNSCSSLHIKDSTFSNINATLGAGLYLSPVNYYTYDIEGSTFSNLRTSEAAGAIWSDGKALNLLSNKFWNNTAADGNAGAIYFNCNTETTGENCESKFQSNEFDGNEASAGGGCVYWDGYEPQALVDGNTYRSRNSAAYGGAYATVASGVARITEEMYQTLKQRAPQATDEDGARVRRLQTAENNPISNVASGQTVAEPLYLALVDKYDQVVLTDSNSEVTLQASDPSTTALGGTLSLKAVNGMFKFDSFSITAEPGSSSAIKVTSSVIKADEGSSEPEIKVDFRYCISGEIKQDKACIKCQKDTYALALDAQVCIMCDETKVDCSGGTGIWPKSGYWRPSVTTADIFTCLRTESCIGSKNQTDPLGACDTGYKGNLCQSCDNSYSRTAKNECTACPDDGENGGRLAGILLGVLIVSIIMVRSTMLSAHRPKEIYSVYLRVFFSYLQLVVLMASFDLNWPSEVRSFLDTQEKAGSATKQVYSFDCWLAENNDTINVYYQKLIIVACLPFFLVLFPCLFWGLVAALRRDKSILQKQLVTTIIVLLFLAHPNIVEMMFSAFSCMEIETNEWWLMEDLDLQCWKGDHLLYTFAIALPGLIAWGIGIPLIALVLLIRNRRTLEEVDTKMKYGFIYIPNPQN